MDRAFLSKPVRSDKSGVGSIRDGEHGDTHVAEPGRTSSWRNPRRAAQRIAVGLVLAALAAVAAAWGLRDLREAQQRRDAFPEQDGSLALPGLRDKVAVLRDGHGVPHILARNERDAWFALGYVHAQDRLAQILWLRQVARGRSAESIGRRGLDADRLARSLDFAGLARAELTRLPPHARKVLEAFADGVNARIARVSERAEHAPVDVERLALPLEAWEPADSLALYKLHAWNRDASIDASLVLSDLIQQLGPGPAKLFDPTPGVSDEAPAPDAQAGFPAAARGSWPLAAALRRQSGWSGRGLGSSAWVLGGGRTESGRPIVAGDLHLDPTVPAAMHLDHLRGGSLEVAGATLPGVPLFWCGHNRKLAWFAVGAPAVVVDLYKERLDEADPTRYHDGTGWRPLEIRKEALAVRGGASEPFEVRRTANGPLLPSLPERPPLSVSWSGALGTGSGFASLLEAAAAEDAAGLLATLREHREPMLAIAYADSSGAAGVQVAGYVPRRSLKSGLAPLDGRVRWYRWRDRVPFEALPAATLTDPQSWLVAADAPMDTRSGETMDWLWRSGARAARIDALLRVATRSGPLGLRQVADLQGDVGEDRAMRIIGLSRELAGNAALGTQAGEVVRLLEEWDGNAAADSAGAATYHVFLGKLIEALLGERVGSELLERYLAVPQADPEQLALGLLESARAAPDGDAQRAAASEAVTRSLRAAWLDLSYRLGANARRWAWGALHPLRFRALGNGPGEESASDIGPFSYGGSADTVSAAPYDFAKPFDVTTASTVRLVMDLGALGQALAAIAPGQTEHPGHVHRDDGLRRWLAGRDWLFATDPLLVEEGSVARLDLEPLR